MVTGNGGISTNSILYSSDGSNWSNADSGGFGGEGDYTGNFILHTNPLLITGSTIQSSINISIGSSTIGTIITYTNPMFDISSNINIDFINDEFNFATSLNTLILNSSTINTLSNIGSSPMTSGIIDITYISSSSGSIQPPSGATYAKITNMAGGGNGNDDVGDSGDMGGGGGGGGGGIVIYTCLLNNYDTITYRALSTINTYSTCLVHLHSDSVDINLIAIYGTKGNLSGDDTGAEGGAGGSAYGPPGSIIILGTNGYYGGNYPQSGGQGIYGGSGGGGGGMGGGPSGGAGGGGGNYYGFDGGFGSGGGGGIMGSHGSLGGPPLITFEWL